MPWKGLINDVRTCGLTLLPCTFVDNNTCTLIECSNRSPKHSDIHVYQSLAVAEQYVFYHDLEHSFWKIFT